MPPQIMVHATHELKAALTEALSKIDQTNMRPCSSAFQLLALLSQVQIAIILQERSHGL